MGRRTLVDFQDIGKVKVMAADALFSFCFMKRDEAVEGLRQHEADLKRLSVEHLYMFGSSAVRPGTVPTLTFFSTRKRKARAVRADGR